MSKVSDLARLTAMTATPHPVSVSPAPLSEPIVRYTAEVPKSLHRSLKTFAMENDTSTYAVTRALLTLLDSDPDVANRVRGLLVDDRAVAR
jgi:hypothetical protein